MRSLLANVDSISSASELAGTVPFLDVVIRISQTVKKLLPETVTTCLKKAGFSMGEVTASAETENNHQDLKIE
jgi:hypothetical protein